MPVVWEYQLKKLLSNRAFACFFNYLQRKYFKYHDCFSLPFPFLEFCFSETYFIMAKWRGLFYRGSSTRTVVNIFLPPSVSSCSRNAFNTHFLLFVFAIRKTYRKTQSEREDINRYFINSSFPLFYETTAD